MYLEIFHNKEKMLSKKNLINVKHFSVVNSNHFTSSVTKCNARKFNLTRLQQVRLHSKLLRIRGLVLTSL